MKHANFGLTIPKKHYLTYYFNKNIGMTRVPTYN